MYILFTFLTLCKYVHVNSVRKIELWTIKWRAIKRGLKAKGYEQIQPDIVTKLLALSDLDSLRSMSVRNKRVRVGFVLKKYPQFDHYYLFIILFKIATNCIFHSFETYLTFKLIFHNIFYILLLKK